MEYFITVLKILKLQGFVWKTMHAWLDGKSCFSHTNASSFRRLLQSLLLRYTAENSWVTYFLYSLSACANNIFQKWTVFVFIESWLRDKVMQRAYCPLPSGQCTDNYQNDHQSIIIIKQCKQSMIHGLMVIFQTGSAISLK